MADLYLGLLTPNGLTTLDTPATDPGLTPVLDTADPPSSPATVPATGGEAERMRILTTALPSGDTLVLGRSMADIDAALTGLRTTLLIVGAVLLAVIALVFWWMRRLGLDPILRVTRVARSISSGDTSQRVEAFPAGTEAHDLGTAFNQLVETNEATQARLRQFVADASHELRTPLVTLKGYAALHSAGGLADEASTDDAMRRIKQEANRMGRLVEDLLLLTEMDQGPLQATSPVDVVEIMTDLAGDLQVIDPERVVSVDMPHSAIVTGDRDRLTQVFAGLTTNALRHTPPGTAIDLRVSQDLARPCESRSPTTGPVSPRRTCPRCSTASTGPMSPGPVPQGAAGWAWPSPPRSCTRTAALSVSRAHPGGEPPSGWSFPRRVSRPSRAARPSVVPRSGVALERCQVPLAAGEQVLEHGGHICGCRQLQGVLQVRDVGGLHGDARVDRPCAVACPPVRPGPRTSPSARPR